MPLYFSELNPIKMEWKFVKKRATKNKSFALLNDLKGALLEHFSPNSRLNETIRMKCPIN